MAIKHRLMNFQLSDNDDGKMQFSGVANGFHTLDCNGCIMGLGAFKRDLSFLLSDGFVGGINHNWDKPIGKPLAAKETDAGLEVSAQLSDTQEGRDVHVLLKDDVIKRLSIYFHILDYKYLETEKDVNEYWKSVSYDPTDEDKKRSRYGALLMNRVKLFEFSPVTMPGNSLTEISNVLSAPPAGAATMEEHVELALAADEELLERIRSLQGKRNDEGRKMSAAWQIRLRKLHDNYAALLAQANEGGADLERNKRMNQAASHEFLSWVTTNSI